MQSRWLLPFVAELVIIYADPLPSGYGVLMRIAPWVIEWCADFFAAVPRCIRYEGCASEGHRQCRVRGQEQPAGCI